MGRRQLLRDIFSQALEVVRGEPLLAKHSTFDGQVWSYRSASHSFEFPIPRNGRLLVVGAGKAAASLAKGAEAVLGERIDGGLIIVKYDHTEDLRYIEQVEAAHPIPDENGVVATDRIVELLDTLEEGDSAIVLLSGGASALMVSPIDGLSLADKSHATDVLIASGASINEINCVRKALSNTKGGRLLERIAPASSITLLISDVPDGDVGSIGSGPTIAQPMDYEQLAEIKRKYRLDETLPEAVVRHLDSSGKSAPQSVQGRHCVHVLADSADLVGQVEKVAREKGLDCLSANVSMQGHTHDEAAAFVAAVKAVPEDQRPCVVVAAGETVLEVSGSGKGGRNQEFALVVARLLQGDDRVCILSAGTDGTDGPTDAAGAFVDGRSWEAAGLQGIDPASALGDNDSYTVFEALDDLFVTGPTGTNVMDIVIALVE